MSKKNKHNNPNGDFLIQSNIIDIIDKSNDGFYIVDSNNVFVYVNKKASEIFGKGELIGKNMWKEFPESVDTIFAKEYKKAAKTNKTKIIEGFYTPKDGWFKVSIFPLDGMMYVYFNDITDQKNVEISKEKMEKMFRSLYKADAIGMVFFDKNGVIKNANDAFLNIIGYSRNDIVEKELDWATITPEEYKIKDIAIVKELLENGYTNPHNKEYIRKDGVRIPILTAGVVLDYSEQEYLGFAVDMSEQKQLEKKKDEFITVVSHELKTPLTNIKGYSQIAESLVGKDNEKVMFYLKKTIKYVEKVNNLITDLLEISRIDGGRMKMHFTEFILEDLIINIIQDTQYRTKSHKIDFDQKTETKIVADEDRLEQVIVNLLSNAIKYSPDATNVVLKISEEDEKVLISIQDFGIGIEAKDMERIFEKFYRIDENSRSLLGLGIGLYISKDIVEKHGGRIRVESETGKGTKFTVELPKSRELAFYL